MLVAIVRSRFHRPVIITLLCIFGLGVPVLPVLAAKNSRPAELSLRGLNGKSISLRSLRGRIIVLNFWATWCGPCATETPMLATAEQQYRPQGIVFLGASLDDHAAQGKIPAFLDRYHVTYPIGLGASAVDLKKLQMGIAIPATAFLDQQGVIRARVLGQLQPGELEDRIDWLLRGETGPAPPAVVTHLASSAGNRSN